MYRRLSTLCKLRSCNVNTIRCSSQFYNENRSYSNEKGDNSRRWFRIFAAGATIGSLILYKIYSREDVLLKAAQVEVDVGNFKPDLPSYSAEEVAQHAEVGKKVWVTYKEGVYDITEFIIEHPGGDQILLAAGSSLEPFWMLYGMHKRPEILNVLETMRIGNLSQEDAYKSVANMQDPYGNEPIRHKALKPASEKPFNAETPPSLLTVNFNTPNEIFYVRNHLPVPNVDPQTYELEIEVENRKKSMFLHLDQIKRFPKHSVSATVMCAGNRRSEMTQVKKVKGLNWGAGTVGNAVWTGAKLRDVLKVMDVTEDSEFKHVQFEGLDTDPSNVPYGASIPFWRAVDLRADVLLAYEMNGEPIPRDHGYPIRVIVPGVVGARNVKWLGKIIVSNDESASHWQQNDYKGFCPSVGWDNVDYGTSPAIQELPVTSAVCVPSPGQTVDVVDGHINVQGYAWSGGGQRIVRVDVTVDGGESWHTAHLIQDETAAAPQHWSWTLWQADVPISKNQKKVEIWSKAVDSSYNVQPESFKHIWNLRGVLSNAYHRVPIHLKWIN